MFRLGTQAGGIAWMIAALGLLDATLVQAQTANNGGATSGGQGQTDAQDIQIIRLGEPNRRANDRNADNLINRPLNRDECPVDGRPSPFHLELFNLTVPQPGMFLDVWEGEGCEQLENRRDLTRDVCRHVSDVGEIRLAQGATQVRIERDVNDFIQCAERDEAGNIIRDEDGVPVPVNGTFTFLFLVVPRTPPDTNNEPASFKSLQIAVRTSAPNAPTVTATPGSRTGTMSWRLPSGEINETLDGFWVCAQASECTAEEPNSGALRAGDMPDAETQRDRCVFRRVATRSAKVRLDGESGIPVGGTATVGVAIRDRAGNTGRMGVACMERIESAGFCEVFEEEEGRPCPSTCQLGSTSASGPLVIGLGLLAWALRRRRVSAQPT